MNRCPDCGFRSKEPLRLCPLCGVRMRDDPNGNTVQMQTHVHKERGEECLLPNTGREDAARAHYRRVMEQQLRAAGEPVPEPMEEQVKAKNHYRSVMEQQLRSAGADSGKVQLPKQAKKLLEIVAVIVLYALLRACTG